MTICYKRIFLAPANVKLKWISLVAFVMVMISCGITILTWCGLLVEDAYVFQVIRTLVPIAVTLYVLYNARYRLRSLDIIMEIIEEVNEECENREEESTMVWSVEDTT